jgi:hypothetical protein
MIISRIETSGGYCCQDVIFETVEYFLTAETESYNVELDWDHVETNQEFLAWLSFNFNRDMFNIVKLYIETYRKRKRSAKILSFNLNNF